MARAPSSLVIPVDAGIHLDLGSRLTHTSADTRAPSMAFFVRLSRPSHFLLSGQEKVTKEKATPEPRPLDILVQRVRESGPGFADSTSVC